MRSRRRHRHGAPGAERRPAPLASPRTSSSASSRSTGSASSTGARMARQATRALETPRHRRRSRHAHGRAAARPAAAGRARPRAVLRRAHHHPGRADLRPVAARGRAAVRACCAGCRSSGTSIVFISHFLDDVLAICDRVTVFRNGRTVATARPATIDKAWLIDRMIGAGHEELEESYTGEIRSQSPAQAPVVLEAQGLTRAGAFDDVSLAGARGRGAGHLRLHGLGPARARPHAVRQAAGRRGRTCASTAGRVRPRAAPPRAKRAGIAFVPESRR